MLGFLIWGLCGIGFVGLGIYSFNAGKPVGFWANAKIIPIDDKDIKAYNSAVGKLWCIFGAMFIVLGLPLLSGQNSPSVIISILGSFFWVITLMISYMRIEKRFRKKEV